MTNTERAKEQARETALLARQEMGIAMIEVAIRQAKEANSRKR